MAGAAGLRAAGRRGPAAPASSRAPCPTIRARISGGIGIRAPLSWRTATSTARHSNTSPPFHTAYSCVKLVRRTAAGRSVSSTSSSKPSGRR